MQITRCGRAWLEQNGVLLVETRPGTEQVLDDAVENIRVTAVECGGVRRPVLVDLLGLKSTTREAPNYTTWLLAQARR